MSLIKRVFAVVIALGLVTGCTNTSGEPDEAAFLEKVRADAPDAEFLTDEQILQVGEEACTQFAEGKTVEDLENSEPGVTDETRRRINVMHQAAANHLCPNP